MLPRLSLFPGSLPDQIGILVSIIAFGWLIVGRDYAIKREDGQRIS
ncbi:hypothetical protein ACFLXI_00315 [Chloroflexota bacterium]